MLKTKRILTGLVLILSTFMSGLSTYSQTLTVESPGIFLLIGDVLLGQSSSGNHSFKIEATGYPASTKIYVEVDGSRPDFKVSDNSSSGFTNIIEFVTDGSGELAPTDVFVTFTPSYKGTQAGYYIMVYDDDFLDYGEKRVRGRGVGPDMQVKFKNTIISNGKTTTDLSDSTNFGSALLGDFTDVKYTIMNSETSTLKGDLILSGTNPNFVVISGSSDFTVHSQPAKTTINPDGDSTLFTVRFLPSSIGVKNATISIANNDLSKNPYTFNVKGEGTASTPTVSTTTPVTGRTVTSASSGGEITADGGASVSARGVCWNTSTGPTISNPRSTDGNGTGTFTSTISGGLSPATKYYVRAYATNDAGTAYGPELEFWTLASEPTSNASSPVLDSKGPYELNISWAAATGANGYVVLQRSGATAPTIGGVTDGHDYSTWTLPGGTTVAGETSGTSITVGGLSAGTQYSFLIIAYGKGTHDDTYNYKTDGTLPSITATTTPAPPATQINDLVWETLPGNKMGFSWSEPAGSTGSIFLMRVAADPVNPVHGVSYTHNNSFTSAPDIGSGTKVVHYGAISGSKAMLEVSDLDDEVVYHFQVLAYNGSDSDISYNTDLVNGSHGETNNSESALPVELLSFTAKFVNGEIVVNWATASETNNDYFTLEHSYDLSEWTEVLTKEGAGNSNSKRHYTVRPENPSVEGLNYYRLRQTDYDGQNTISEVAVVNTGLEYDFTEAVSIFPNPAKTSINISGITEDTDMYIYNITGVLVYERRISSYSNEINLSRLSGGVYILVLKAGEKSAVKKIVLE